MKKTLIALLFLAAVSSSCLAFGILTTGTTVGQDKFTVQGMYSTTGFNIVNTAASIAGIGVKGTYGATKDLDLFADYWTGSFVDSDFDFSEAASSLGVGLKYGFLKTSDNDPIDLAGFIELASLTSKDYTWGTNTFGISASKLLRPNFTLYGTAAILMNSAKVTGAKAVSESDTQFGLGVKYDVNSKFAVLGEITRFTFDSDGYQTIAVAGEFKI